jgi:pimeloyl-ACP methyl ester carboxylesterase
MFILYTAIGFTVFAALCVYSLGLYRMPRYIKNFEEREYGDEQTFVEPVSADNGLAVYSVGTGEPVLLFPYPHAHTTVPMAQEPLAGILTGMGRTVITFDVPGAYRSYREPVGDMAEILGSAEETLDRLGIDKPVDVVGHSMGGLCALAFAAENPEKTRSLVLIGSMSGFPAVARLAGPGSYFKIYNPDYWRLVFWGIRVTSGRADLATHKKLQNLMEGASYADKSLFEPITIDSDDRGQGVPVRMIWSKNMYSRLSYADRLGTVEAPTLVAVGRQDPEAPLPCSEELASGIPNALLVVFERSGHMPFIEEAGLFTNVLHNFYDGIR